MTLNDAETIVHKYGAALESECAKREVGFYVSRLPQSSEAIIQAMKLLLAHDIENRSLTEETRNVIGTGASMLARFIDDNEAQRLNDIKRQFKASDCVGLPPEEFKKRVKIIDEVHDWMQSAMLAGLTLRRELCDFVEAVEQFETIDPLYWQRVYTLAGLHYSAPDKRSICDVNEQLSKHQCEEIVHAFIDCMADNPPLLGDCSLLPYPKSVILHALGEMLNDYERQQKAIDDPDLRNPYDDIIPKIQHLSNTLIYQWHDIDPEDKDAIAALNRLSSYPAWALPLKQKYLNDDRASNEAFDAALKRMNRRVAAENANDQ